MECLPNASGMFMIYRNPKKSSRFSRLRHLSQNNLCQVFSISHLSKSSLLAHTLICIHTQIATLIVWPTQLRTSCKKLNRVIITMCSLTTTVYAPAAYPSVESMRKKKGSGTPNQLISTTSSPSFIPGSTIRP